MASDYQGETIQVFVFFRGKFLGYQCFAQDRLTIGGAPGMDLPLPDCPESEGYWDVYLSRGGLYVWFRGLAGGEQGERPEDPRKVQPLDSFSLGEYRLQVKLLEGQGLVQPSIEAEEDLPADREAASPEEASEPDELPASPEEEGQEASSFVEPGEGEESNEEPVPEPPNEVEGISIDYARSIWREEEEPLPSLALDAEEKPVEEVPDRSEEKDQGVEALDADEEGAEVSEDPADLGTEEDLSRDDEGQAVAGEDRKEGSQEEPSPEAEEEAEPELAQAISPDYVKDIWGLSEEEETGQQEEEESEADIDGPVASDEEAPRADTADEWIGFGLEEEDPSGASLLVEEAEEEPQRDEPLGEPSPEDMSEEEEDLITLGEAEASDEAMEIGSAGDGADAVEPSEDASVALSEEIGPSDQPAPSADLKEMAPLETEPDDQTSVQLPLVAESGGAVDGMSQEERTKFWDDMAKEALANEDKNAGKAEPEEAPVEASSQEEAPVDAIGDLPPAEEEVLPDPEPTPASEPAFASERLESANAAVAIDDAEAEEGEEEEEGWEDEDEDEEEQDISYFSLVKEVFPSRAQESKTPYGDRRALEVVRFRGRDIQDIGYLEGGNSYTIRKGWNRSVWKRRGGVPPNFKLARMKNGGLAELHIRESVNGRIYSDGGSQDIWDLRGGKRGRFGLKGQASWLPLPADTWAVLRVNSGRYLVRYVSPRPKPAVQPLRPNVSMGQFKLVSLSMLSHLLLILVIGLAVPDRTLEGYNRMDQFARIDPNALQALKPPPPPKELKKPKPVAKKKTPKPKPKAASKHRVPKSAQRSPVPTKGKASGGGKKEVDVAQTGLLAALGGPDAGVLDAKGNSAILLAAVTNLDAVAVPSDTTTFNLAGVAGKLATSEIQVPTSDVIETVGAAQLIKNGDGTLGAMASKGTGEVRAIVHEPPKAKISIRGGMSREAVLKVVNAHLDEVRDCYERELLHNPGISGKILMEWLIQLDGSVRYAKVKFTNIGHSSDLHTCIQAQVVTWNFPRPKGGQEVMVTFPFLFESMGF